MGASFTNYQLRVGSSEDVIHSLVGVLKAPAYVTSPLNGWVSVYSEASESQDDQELCRVAQELSSRLSAAVFSFLVHDSDIFRYWLHEQGQLNDRYDSNPAYFAKASATEKARLRGKPELILPYCVPGTTLRDIEEVLHPKKRPTFIEVEAAAFANLLGIDEKMAVIGYQGIEQDGDYSGINVKTLRLIGMENLSQEYKDNALQKSLLQPTLDNIQKWIALGANVNGRDHLGIPFLVKTALGRRVNFILALLVAGADVNATVSESRIEGFERGVTALMRVAGLYLGPEDGVMETLQVLLDAGADVNAQSETGRTPLKEAFAVRDNAARMNFRKPPDFLEKAVQRSTEVVRLLRQAGAHG